MFLEDVGVKPLAGIYARLNNEQARLSFGKYAVHGGYKVHGAPVAVLRRKRVSGRIFHLAGVVQDRVVLSKRPCPILYEF